MARQQRVAAVLLLATLLLVAGCASRGLLATAPDPTATPTKTPRPTHTPTRYATATRAITPLPPTDTPEPSPTSDVSPTPVPTPTALPTSTFPPLPTFAIPLAPPTPAQPPPLPPIPTLRPSPTPRPSNTPLPTNTPLPPDPYTGTFVGWVNDCNGSQVRGTVTDAAGNRLVGVPVRVWVFGNVFGDPPLTNSVGDYEFNRFGTRDPLMPVHYTVAVLDPATGAIVSNVVFAATMRENCESSGGQQVAIINFVKN